LRVVADHVRSSLMLISDGVTPSNDGRGYILRRLLRRTVRAMRLMGVDTPVFPELFTASRDAMKAAYPEVEADYARISNAAYAEEETFLRTLAGGTTILDTAVAETKASGRSQLAGDTAFLLHDTWGFPIDLTLEVAEEAGLSVDRTAFDTLMQEQRQRAKADAKAKKGQIADLSVYSPFRTLGETVFTGYGDFTTDSEVLGLIVDGIAVDRAGEGRIAEVILKETALYAESGGQDSDQGTIVGPGYELEVLDVQKPVAGLISHTVRVTVGEVAVGAKATSIVDQDYRRGANQAHSGTHIVHAALRQLLGSNAHQSGSYNKAGYLRLDFSWNKPLSAETRTELEEISNNAIRSNLQVTTRTMPIADAKALGAMALFGEKYGDQVRMVEIGGAWSRELCGGTHVAGSSEIGMINLIGESSVGSTNRRVESLVGMEAFREFAAERAIVNELTSNLKTPREKLPERINDLVANLKAAEKKIAQFEAKQLAEKVPALAQTAARAGKVLLVAQDAGELKSGDELRQLAMGVRERLGTDAAVVALTATVGGRPLVLVATNQAARDAGAKAGALVGIAAGVLGGRGGGKDDLAQGGGAEASAVPAALSAIADALSA
ncbi:MAG: alanine--tRNA ligase, partial [Microbacteriaceae bacterium]|nr:alanine--tRNA ligase [Microbacteriaceae bacterium]